MDRKVDTGNRQWYIWLGLLATGITFFVFITGKNLPDVFRPKSGEAEKGSPVTEYFPLFVGSIRTYTVGRSTRLGEHGELEERVSTFTEQVMIVESSSNEAVHSYKVEQRGGIMDLECTGLEAEEGTYSKWYITDETSLYVACSEEQKYRIFAAVAAQRMEGATPGPAAPLPDLVFPLEVGKRWPVIPEMAELPAEFDPQWQWHVESREVMETAAGKFNECFKIALHTLSSTLSRYICKGAGVVALEYHHFGTQMDYRVELSAYSRSGNP